MSRKLIVKSRFGDYEVSFVNSFDMQLQQQRETCFFLVDSNVMEIFRAKIECILPGGRVTLITARELCKTIEYCHTVIEQLVEQNIRRNDTLVVVGGGVVQDIGSFIASILFRGIDWHFYPTTLLAQADSCIGSKSSLNLGRFKNILGTFYPPSKIVVDVTFLETLPVDEIKSGIGEMLHFYLVDGSEMARELVENYDEVIKNRHRFDKYIQKSLEIKKNMVEIDEFDKNERRIFNYGHTFGHAIESVSGYTVKHGQAVTMGMDIANFVSHRYGYLETEVFEKMRKLLVKNMPTFSVNRNQLIDYFGALLKDKKNIGENVGCILTRGPGRMQQMQVPVDEKFKRIISDYFQYYNAKQEI